MSIIRVSDKSLAGDRQIRRSGRADGPVGTRSVDTGMHLTATEESERCLEPGVLLKEWLLGKIVRGGTFWERAYRKNAK